MEMKMKNAKQVVFAAWLLAMLVLVGLWMYPGTAFAQAEVPGEEAPAAELLTMIVKIVFSVVGILGAYLSTKAIKFFEKKTKIDIPAATEKTIFEWADKGVSYAHEKAHQAAQAGGRKLNGNEKLNIALQFVSDLVQKHNLDAIAEERLRRYIESKLGEKRIDGGALPPAT
jgi:hypothetical protein